MRRVDAPDAAVPDATAPGSDATTAPPTVRVLFIGNSYTGVNDLPHVVARLAEAPESPVRFEVGQYTPGGQTWEGHDADPRVDELIQEGWDYVVLQDQSQQPWWGPPTDVKPALLSLDAKIRSASAQTVLFMTWARAEAGGLYQDMLVDSYYVQAGEATSARVAPVGRAWERARRDPSMTLHAADGSHPNERGTYLAACVIYATLTEQSPVGLGDGGLGITDAETGVLQRVALESIEVRRRPIAPLLGRWPLSSEGGGNDLIPGGDLSVGDTVGPDGSSSSATRFTGAAYAAVPYFAGLNTPELTVSFEAYRDDWSQPTDHREYLAVRDVTYQIHLEGSALSAAVFLRSEDDVAGITALPVPPGDPPPSVELTFESDGLTAGWHRVTLTHDGVTAQLWIDGESVASTAIGAPVACAEAGSGCAVGIVLGVETSALDSRNVPQFAFTGALADLQVFETALTAEQIGAL